MPKPTDLLPPFVQARLRELPRGLRKHIERSREIARGLAEQHGVDLERVDLAVAAHDLARALKADALLEQARRHGLRVRAVERRYPVLLHGPIAALWLEREGGVADGEVLGAVRWHTTGNRAMGPLAKVVFLADKLDPTKLSRYPYLDQIRDLAEHSLDGALLEFLDRELANFLRERRVIHPHSLVLRNRLMVEMEA